ncbi:MAG: ATP-binding protein [Desulfobacterales bacterium]|jgi:signal transduction histidine kinase
MVTIALRKNDNQNLFGKTLIMLLGCFFIYVLVISRPYEYKMFWLFIYPPAAFFLLGRNLASLFSGIFFVIVSIFFLFQEYFPLVSQHDAEFKLTFLSTFFIIGLVSFVFESTRYRYKQKIEKNKLLLAHERKKVIEAEKSNISIIRAKNQFLANMSHELRTPLNHMIGFTELVVDQKFGKLNQTQREFLNDALGSSKYLFALINDILDLKKLETGKLELLISEIDTKSFIEDCITMIRERALNHGIELSVNLDRIPTIFKADRPKLQQVMYNLISNAAKFTPDGGVVTVIARRVQLYCHRVSINDGAQVVWTIQDPKRPEISAEFEYRTCIEFIVGDNGIGIKTADLERIFKRFEQADGSSRKKFQGTGLGLSLSKRYVELHGGRIWAQSDGDGKGSTFTFVIPS